MQITILTDNHAGGRTKAEHGLSYLVEIQNEQILFDAGQSTLFIENAKLLNYDLSKVSLKVLSHGHFDHGDGFKWLSGGRLFLHPGCFVNRYRKADHSYIGLNQTEGEFQSNFNLHATTEPVEMVKNVYFLGEIPRNTTFEAQSTSFVFENGDPDFVTDDSGIVIVLPEGLFVITGCGHAGLVNTLEHAKKTIGINKIYGVMGGFHLKSNNLQTKETINYLKKENVSLVYPSHCVALPAMVAFSKAFHNEQLITGKSLTF